MMCRLLHAARINSAQHSWPASHSLHISSSIPSSRHKLLTDVSGQQAALRRLEVAKQRQRVGAVHIRLGKLGQRGQGAEGGGWGVTQVQGGRSMRSEGSGCSRCCSQGRSSQTGHLHAPPMLDASRRHLLPASQPAAPVDPPWDP